MANPLSADARLLRNVLFKASVLFIAFNLLYIMVQPLPLLDHLTLYNYVFPGRDRFPWSEQPAQSFSVSLSRLDAMFASHVLAGTPKAADEYRVLFLGDSAVWGLEIGAEAGTPPALLNDLALRTTSGKRIRAYNLAYPGPNALRDALILQHALAYQPDLIVWPLTLQTLNAAEFTQSDIVQAQAAEAQILAQQAGLTLSFPPANWLDRTLWGQRAQLAAWLQHQLQGVAWAASGIDFAPEPFRVPPPFDLTANREYDLTTFHTGEKLLITAITSAAAQQVPVLLINEPIYVSSGSNSDVRYNADYPRWAYDQYRNELTALARTQGWRYLDLWNAVPPAQFIRTSLHYTPEGARTLAEKIGAAIQG